MRAVMAHADSAGRQRGGAGPLRAHHRGRDRYLICSDGLTAVLDDEMVGEVLRSESDRDAAVARYLRLANAGGGPDNITCIVADFVDAPAADGGADFVVGAAASKRRPA